MLLLIKNKKKKKREKETYNCAKHKYDFPSALIRLIGLKINWTKDRIYNL